MTCMRPSTENKIIMNPIPDCLGPRPLRLAPARQLPQGAWDTHFHALGPQSRFPYAAKRKYSPPDAPLEDCLRFHDALGIEHGLVVHANTHGFDNSVDLDAVGRSGGRYYGVVRLDRNASAQSCADLHAKGCRGVRFAFNPQHGGSLDCAVFDHVMRCIDGLGWFVELHFDGQEIPAMKAWLESIPGQVVVDHFGRIDVGLGVEQEPFQVLLSLVGRGNFWIKLSGADRISRLGYPYADVAPFASALTALRADRLLWGSDWPHTGYFDSARVPDDAQLVDSLFELVPDERARQLILVENPVRLLHGAT
jgi:predicted TIM-barrel fold metal-dependent hydrolase